ncbi:MAG: MaoC family dehydratase N-terminal domain-containing protein [Firmicutes bacterium]|nr:MaoC family dehydratase N-terminal domain-containing protein [Bacillota bacterium]
MDVVDGTWGTAVQNVISAAAVVRFARALGDENPAYTDPTCPQAVMHGGCIAPPTFARTLAYGELPGAPTSYAGAIHGEQSFVFTRPLRVGEVVYCRQRLAQSYERAGMRFYVIEQRCDDTAGAVICTQRLTIIVRKAG